MSRALRMLLLVVVTPAAAPADSEEPTQRASPSSSPAPASEPRDDDYRIERAVVRKGYDGKRCWVHARAGVIPPARPDAPPKIVLTAQELDVTGSDIFDALHSTTSADLGATWSGLERQEAFARQALPGGDELTVCDFTPGWHAASRTLLGIGQTVRYRGRRVLRTQRRAVAYSVHDPSSERWKPWRALEMPAEPRFASCGAGSVQRYDLPSGEILLPVSFKAPEERSYSVTVLRCRFDGTELRYLEHGSEHTVASERGLYEPSLTRFGPRFYLTMRNDDRGYVAAGSDGLRFDEPRPWTFDDGSELGSYNTQQHWVAHERGLFLVYTRRGAENDHVFRHRAPLFMARVDPERVVVLRDSERVLIPERGARLGNFGVVDVSPTETWVTAAEWMQTWAPQRVIPVDDPRGADNSIHVVRILWSASSARKDSAH